MVISIDRDHLPPHTEDEYEAWVKFCIGQTGGISIKNPLHDLDMDAIVREFG